MTTEDITDDATTENVTVLRLNRMTQAQYAAKREELAKLYGDGTHGEAVAHADQAFAKLFWQSGCTQEELAEWEGKSRQWITQHVLFGRFLEFATTGSFSQNTGFSSLSERRFRGFWARTDGTNERQRFMQVIRLMEEAETAPPPPPAKDVAAVIIEQFGDGKWYQLVAIVEDTGHPEIAVVSTLNRMRRGAYGVKAEQAKVGRSWKYRIFKQDKTISSSELAQKLRPLIKELEVEGRKGPATACPPAVAHLAHQLKQLLQQWTE